MRRKTRINAEAQRTQKETPSLGQPSGLTIWRFFNASSALLRVLCALCTCLNGCFCLCRDTDELRQLDREWELTHFSGMRISLRSVRAVASGAGQLAFMTRCWPVAWPVSLPAPPTRPPVTPNFSMARPSPMPCRFWRGRCRWRRCDSRAGPCSTRRNWMPRICCHLEPDRMLYYLRQRAGLPPKAKAGYGGWDGEGRQLTGHIAGHYLSAVSYMFAATGDPRFQGTRGLYRQRTEGNPGPPGRRLSGRVAGGRRPEPRAIGGWQERFADLVPPRDPVRRL